jgi:hypothetical protein
MRANRPKQRDRFICCLCEASPWDIRPLGIHTWVVHDGTVGAGTLRPGY